jgi:hypothetical protein
MQYEDEAYLAFYPREDPIQHDPTPTVAILQWHGCDGAVLGPPNDEEAGIPPEAIVLGFRPQNVRTYSGFAIA